MTIIIYLMVYSRFYARRLFDFQWPLTFLSFALLYIYYTILFAVCQEVSQKFFVNFLWISLTSPRCCLFLCCDYIIPYSEAFVNIDFYITLYQIWYIYSFFDFAYSISKLNLWILQYDFVNRFWILILDLDFDFVFGFIVCTYNRLILSVLYSWNVYKKFKKNTWIGAPDMI